jgi:methylglutaconyl-CoA hydratase
MEKTPGYVKSERDGYSLVIEFFHPQSNSLPTAMLNDLASHFQAAGLNEEIRVIILRSAGERAFCAGASFTELSNIKNAKEGEAFFNGFAHVINNMRKCPKLIIARIQGKAVGGGVGLAAAADYTLAIKGAEIKLSELEIGIGPFVVGPAVERKLGPSAFSQLTINSGTWYTADWAKTFGLYAEVHQNINELDDSVRQLVNRLGHAGLNAIREIKKMLWSDTSHWDQLLPERAKISGELVVSETAQRAIAMFNKV